MMLKFEDTIYKYSPRYEYINSIAIKRIRITRNRIYIYCNSMLSSIFVANTKYNRNELKKIDITESLSGL